MNADSPARSGTSDNRRHEPERWYYEHDSCIHPDLLIDALPELSDEDEQIAADYESDYYEAHFQAGEDGDIEACERSFEGYACGECSEDQGSFVAWPCEFGDASLPLPEPRDTPPDLPERLRVLMAEAEAQAS